MHLEAHLGKFVECHTQFFVFYFSLLHRAQHDALWQRSAHWASSAKFSPAPVFLRPVSLNQVLYFTQLKQFNFFYFITYDNYTNIKSQCLESSVIRTQPHSLLMFYLWLFLFVYLFFATMVIQILASKII